MQVDFAPSRPYAFTLRKTNLKKGVTTKDYLDHIEKFHQKGFCELVEYVFEKTAGLHMHGILQIPEIHNSFKIFTYMFRVRGWNIKLEELYNLEGWRYYMMKEQAIKENDNEVFENDSEESFIEQPLNLKKSLFKKRATSVSD